MTPEIALEAAMLGEGVYDGDGLTNSARAAIMRVCGASTIASLPVTTDVQSAPTPYLTLV